MAILHLVRCDVCGTDTPMTVTANSTSVVTPGGNSIHGLSYIVPSSIKQIGGYYFCSWTCVSMYATKRAEGAE